MAINLATLFYQVNTSSIQAATNALHAHGAAALTASRSAQGFQSTMARMQQPLVNMRSALGFLQAGLSQVAAGLGAVAVIQYADAWNRMVGRLAAAKVPMEDIADIQNEIVDIAIRSRTPLEAVGNLYSRIARSSEALGVSQADVARATETIAMALKTSGATAQETTSSLIQLSQALQKGTLNGDELRSILEQSPPLANAIAREFGVTVGQLQKMGAEGKLFATRVMKAILDSTDEVERAFRAMPMTVADAWTNLLTKVEEYVGELNQATGATSPLIEGMKILGDNIDRVGRAAGVIVAVLGSIATLRLGSAILALGASFGWIGIVATALTGLVATLSAFKDATIETGRGTLELQDYMAAILRYINEFIDQVEAAIAEMPSFEDAFGIDDQKVIAGFKLVVNSIIGFGVFMIRSFIALKEESDNIWAGFVSGIEEPINKLLNWLADTFESLINEILGSLNSIIDGINYFRDAANQIAKFDMVNIGNFKRLGDETAQADLANVGDRLAIAFGQAFQASLQDYVGDAANSVLTTFDIMASAVEERARSNAYFRRKREDSASEAEANREYNRMIRDQNKPPGMKPPPSGGKPKANDYSRELEQTAKQTEALQIQIATFGMAEGAVARYRAEMELRNAAAREGITLDENAESRIMRVADAYGDAVEQLQQLNDQKEAANWMAQTLFDAVRGAESLADAFNKLTTAIIDTLLQATLLGQGPLAGIFGTQQSGGALGGIFQTLLGGLMGGIGGGAGATPIPRTNPFFGHSGGLVGYSGVDPSYFASLPRFGRGGWPGLTPGEVPIVAHKGEVIGWPDQMKSAFGSGKTEIQINNYAGNNVEARNERGPDGERVVIDIMKKAVASGQLDGPNRARYGVRPKKVVA